MAHYAGLSVAQMTDYRNRMRDAGGKVKVASTQQYLNMAEYMKDTPEVVENAMAAIRHTGMEPALLEIRGGTDGARLSEMGIPTPKLSREVRVDRASCHGAGKQGRGQSGEAIRRVLSCAGSKRGLFPSAGCLREGRSEELSWIPHR